MDSLAPLFIVAGFAIIFVAIGIWTSRVQAQRTRELEDFAARTGLQMCDSGAFDAPYTSGFLSNLFSSPDYADLGFIGRFANFYPFGIGYDERVRHLMIGTKDNTDWYFFDYYYTTGAGKSKTSHHFSILAARVPYTFPKLSLKPENVLTKVGEHLGLHELHFESNEFNQRYYITCDEEKEAYDILCPQVIDYMLQQPTRYWQLFSMYMMVVSYSPLRAEDCYQFMGEVTGFLSKIPNYVRQDRGFQPKWTSAFEGP